MIITATGHRPNKVGGYSYENHLLLVSIAEQMLNSIENISEVRSGGALGWDQAIARAGINLKLPVHMMIPFEGFSAKWPEKSQQYLEKLISKSNKVTYVCEPPYAAYKLQQRNLALLNGADVCIALWNGDAEGGTWNTIKVAQTMPNLKVLNAWDEYVRKTI
jgi:uncharacterized phage-like protein YoqJ